MGWEGEKKLIIGIQRGDGGYFISVADNGPGVDITKLGKKRMGLQIVSKTIAAINAQNKKKIRFSLKNLKDDTVNTIGCQARIYIPTYIKWQ